MDEAFRSIGIDGDKCAGRMKCLRACPTQAIRVRGGKAALLADRCIECGECVRVCPTRAIYPRTSPFGIRPEFKYTIALPSPVFYSQFGKDVRPASVLAALKLVGFDDAVDVACASESVSIAIQEYLDTCDSPRPLISPFCPAIVRLIQISYPALLNNLIPIESPMEIAAREAKRIIMRERGLHEHEIGAFYLTPCPAKMTAIKNPPRKKHSFLDGAIPISEVFPRVLGALAHTADPDGAQEVRGLGLGWPILGGQVSCLKAEERIAIAGFMDVMRVFDDIENGRLKDIQYIECHSCPTGCVGGSLTVENPYIARGRVLRQVERYGAQPCQDRAKVRELYRASFFSLVGSISPTPLQPLDDDIQRAIQKMSRRNQMYDSLPKIDCGACGAPTCMAFATDVVKGEVTPDECIFVAVESCETLSRNMLATIGRHRKKNPGGRKHHDA